MMVAERFENQFRQFTELEGRSRELMAASEADAERISVLEQLRTDYEAKLGEAGLEIQTERERVEAEKRKVAELGDSLQEMSRLVES